MTVLTGGSLSLAVTACLYQSRVVTVSVTPCLCQSHCQSLEVTACLYMVTGHSVLSLALPVSSGRLLPTVSS